MTQVAIFDDLHLMGAPEGEESEIEEMIGALQFGIERGQERRIISVRALEERFADFNLIAARYGIVDCLVIGGQLPAIRDPDHG